MNRTDAGGGRSKRERDFSLNVGRAAGLLYEALLKEYKAPRSSEELKSISVLCARLSFCLYAEAAGLFGKAGGFRVYLRQHGASSLRRDLLRLFEALDTPPEKRDLRSEEALSGFPYVGSGLFGGKSIEIPDLSEELRCLLLEEADPRSGWSEMSPTVFGAMLESTLNPLTRRCGGMHYTSAENIHKVIDPLFLDDLKAELEDIRGGGAAASRRRRLMAFREKLSGLVLFDPACGGGNFLTEAYICLRRLENEALALLCGERASLAFEERCPVRVSAGQLYGIEIDAFAAAAAKTALWTAENQMLRETEAMLKIHREPLPPKAEAHIVEGNALRLDWEKVVPKNRLSFIIGNPPFVGYSLQSREQKADMLRVYADEGGRPYRAAGKIDYAAAWFFKAAQLMSGSGARSAFVATNSIAQGEQAAQVWRPLYERFGVHIDFAYQTFRWNSESAQGAQVHCVIIGFSCAQSDKPRKLFAGESFRSAENINFYLLSGSCVFIESRREPICRAPAMSHGGKPVEGGFLILTEAEKEALLKAEPQAAPYIRPFMMGKDFIERRPRYCLWLVGVDPEALKSCRQVRERIEKVREYRLRSSKAATRRKAEAPMLFDEITECASGYVAMPKVSSGLRRYIPVGCAPQAVIPGDSLFVIPGAGLYELGVLSSSMHMAWTRAFCGRLKSDYSYSNSVVYNNFPWPEPTEEQRSRIERTAQAILEARALYPRRSFAELYDDAAMPEELRRAHRADDEAVAQAYGLDSAEAEEDSLCLAHLMELYQRLASAAG